MAAQILHGSSSASLSAEEKETFKLVFEIDKGSTTGSADIGSAFTDIASKALDKMESWQILLAIATLAACYLGARWIDHRTAVKGFETADAKSRRETEAAEAKSKREAEAAEAKAKREAEAAEARHRLEMEASEKRDAEHAETIQKLLESHKEMFEAAMRAGIEGRTSIIKGVSGISHAQIGMRDYDWRQINQIKRRASPVPPVSETRHLCVTVDELDTRTKGMPGLVLHVKDSKDSFKAILALNPDDYADFDKTLDIIWNSARFADRYFWAEVTFIRCRDKLLSATVSSIGLEEADLAQYSEGSEEADE